MKKNEYEEVMIECGGCGKKIKVVKIKEYNMDNFLCQKCRKG